MTKADWLRSEIEKLENMYDEPHEGTKYVSQEQSSYWVDGYNQALTTLITRYTEELKELEKGT